MFGNGTSRQARLPRKSPAPGMRSPLFPLLPRRKPTADGLCGRFHQRLCGRFHQRPDSIARTGTSRFRAKMYRDRRFFGEGASAKWEQPVLEQPTTGRDFRHPIIMMITIFIHLHAPCQPETKISQHLRHHRIFSSSGDITSPTCVTVREMPT